MSHDGIQTSAVYSLKKSGRRRTLKQSDARLGFILILPSILLIGAIIVYPVLYNLYLSFHRVSLNPLRPHVFVGIGNYVGLFTDRSFLETFITTVVYVLATVLTTTTVGLLVALLMNREYKGRKYARSIIILPYVAPVISVVFVWQYMFNSIYGVVNYMTVDILPIFSAPPAWFDNPVLSMFLVVLFDTWRVFPYSFMMLLAALQAIDVSLYEAADVDGVGSWGKFWHITFPEILPVIGALVILRTIWNFYKFDDVYLLTNQVPIIGVYLYETAFRVNNHGRAAAITIVLFIVIMAFVLFFGRKVLKRR